MLSPWFPCGLDRPNRRSFRKSLAIVSYIPGYEKKRAYSFSFQNANAMFWKPCVSETPAIPSSPHLKALERASSWVKSIDN